MRSIEVGAGVSEQAWHGWNSPWDRLESTVNPFAQGAGHGLRLVLFAEPPFLNAPPPS